MKGLFFRMTKEDEKKLSKIKEFFETDNIASTLRTLIRKQHKKIQEKEREAE